MSNKLYIGNLPYSVNEESLQDLFAQAGTVTSAKVIKDKETGRSKGFGFVEMSSGEEAQAAIDQLDGGQIGGRALRVSIARPQQERGGDFGGGERGERPQRFGGNNRFGGGRDRN